MASSKKSRSRFRYQLQLVFDTEEEKEEFIESMDTVRRILSSRSFKQLDNLALIRTLFAMAQERCDAGGESDDTRSTVETSTDKRHTESMREDSGNYN